jgi:hypothetical protein
MTKPYLDKVAEALRVVGLFLWVPVALWLPFEFLLGEAWRPPVAAWFLAVPVVCIVVASALRRQPRLVFDTLVQLVWLVSSADSIIVPIAAREAGWDVLSGRVALVELVLLALAFATAVYLWHMRARHRAA